MIGVLLSNTLIAQGIDVIDTGLSTTPTVEMAVVAEKAQGGVVITASHNPVEWNALKLLNDAGEFISAEFGTEVLKRAEQLPRRRCAGQAHGREQREAFQNERLLEPRRQACAGVAESAARGDAREAHRQVYERNDRAQYVLGKSLDSA